MRDPESAYLVQIAELENRVEQLTKANKIAVEALNFYASKNTYSRLQDSKEIERIVLWGDSTEQNDACHYAGRRSREAITRIAEILNGSEQEDGDA